MSNDFAVTRNLFKDHIGYSDPLSYPEWMNIPDEDKAAVLYVQFYDQITLAWYKLKSVYSVDADGVAEVLQYLQKNVDKIKSDEKRFSPRYIYKVAYNCLYCLCRDPNRYKRTYENECSNVVGYGDDELDLFDTVVDRDSDIKISDEHVREYFWNLIEDTDMDTRLVVAKLLGDFVDFNDGGSTYSFDEYQTKLHESWSISDKKDRAKYMSKKAPKGHRLFSEEELNSVSPERELEIINDLRSKLAPFIDIFM